jgi:hypothetical protein
MGHYDERYEASELRLLNEKRKRQTQRQGMLHSIIASVGFGKSDYDNTIVEQEIARHLDLAYELLSMIILADELQSKLVKDRKRVR